MDGNNSATKLAHFCASQLQTHFNDKNQTTITIKIKQNKTHTNKLVSLRPKKKTQ